MLYYGILYMMVLFMICSYNKPRKIKITKTEIRKQTGITMNKLAKMGKNEPVFFGNAC
jgi:DNA-binding Xre family transcriptional regulator